MVRAATETESWTITRAFRHSNYRAFFLGQLVSLLGSWIQSVAQSWLVYRMTESALELSIVAFLSQAPTLVLGPLAGSAADRWSRRHVLLATQGAAAVLATILAVLTLTQRVSLPQVRVVALSLGVVNAFDTPARHAFVVDLVGRRDLPNAIVLNSTLFNGARMVGPTLAALLLGLAGEGVCFVLNAVSYLPVLYILGRMQLPSLPPRPVPASNRELLLEGFRFVGRSPLLLEVFTLLAVSSAFGTPYLVLLPLFAEGRLQAGAAGLGLLTACTGAGALLGALYLAARAEAPCPHRKIPAASAAFGIGIVAFAAVRSVWLSGAALALVGFSLMILLALSSTTAQTAAPDALRGRVMAIHTTIYLGLSPLGAFTAGAAAERWGAAPVVAVGGAICALAGAIAIGRQRLRSHPLP